jgi:archaellum component FlaC
MVEGLKNEVHAMKSRCDTLEKTVKQLESICDTQQRTLETFRQHIINIQEHLGILDLGYEGEAFEVMQ